MIEETDFETYLNISKNKFQIFLFDKKKFTNLYKNEFIFKNKNQNIDFNILHNFLEHNIFKIEKLIGKFVKNIFLIVENYKILNLIIGIKKKNYQQKMNTIFFEKTLTEGKDLFKETYQDYKIMHMVIKKFSIDGNSYPKFVENLSGNNLFLEIQFISIPNNFSVEIERVLEKFQIKVLKYLNENYILNLFLNEKSDMSNMASKIVNGFNENEVALVPKSYKKIGFFEKFFQLFS